MEINKLKEIIADVLNIDVESIKPESNFIEDLGADSLDLFQIITAIETFAGVEFDIEKADSIKTVSDALNEIKRLSK